MLVLSGFLTLTTMAKSSPAYRLRLTWTGRAVMLVVVPITSSSTCGGVAGAARDLIGAGKVLIRSRFQVTGMVHEACQVDGPTRPSTANPFSCWNWRQTVSLLGP